MQSRRSIFKLLLLFSITILLGACSGGEEEETEETGTTLKYTIGGTVSGLAGSSLTLQNNGGDVFTTSTDGSFTFAYPIADGGSYNVTPLIQPTNPNQTCSVSNGSGTVSGTNISNIAVTCVTNPSTVGGTVYGLAGSGLVLQNNGGDDLIINANGGFTFATPVAAGGSYNVTVQTQPTSLNQTCNVSNGSGTASGTNISNIAVTCVTNTYTIGGTVSGLAGSGLILRNNLKDSLTISADGSFNFPTPITDGGSYSVTVLTQPTSPRQTCSVSNGVGTVSGANVSNIVITCVTNTYTIGGTVYGLSGSGLVLQNNGGDDLAISANGGFTFATPITDSGSYNVTVLTQPASPNQTCTITNGSGTLAGASVINVAVNCTTNTYTIGVTVAGLSGSGMVLQNNGGDDLAISADGSFTFTTPLADGSDYAISVLTQPTDLSQTCAVSNGSGTLAGANITNVTVNCTTNTYTIGGTVSGLTGSGLVLQNNGGDNLTISADGSFTFTTPVADGDTYAISVLSQPTTPNQTCAITNGNGTLAGANITNVAVDCTTNAYTVGVTVSGLAGSGLVLQNNGGDDLAISADGSFTFATPITDGGSYSVTVLTQPSSPNQTCAVTNGSGNLAGANVTNVAVDCTTNTYTVGVTVAGLSGSGMVLQNNLGDDLTVNTNGSFTFVTPITDGNSYSVTILSQPSTPSQTCTVNAGSGTVSGADVTSVGIACPLPAVTPSMTATQPKVLTFFWNDVGADYYRLLKNPDGSSGYTQIGTDITTTSVDETIPVHLQDWVNASYIVQACEAVSGSCSDSAPLSAASAMLDAIGYFKASNTQSSDYFGANLALSGDGNTLAVVADNEDSAATGIDGDQLNNNASGAGAVYLFTRSGGTWAQQAYIKASNTDSGDWFGFTIALSDDGNTLAVGARDEDSSSIGIDGNQSDNTAFNSGAVYLFTRSGTTWSQQAYLKASNTDADDNFGRSLDLSADGNTLAVGAPGEASSATGVDGVQSDNSTAGSGAVYLFSRSGSTWVQQSYLKASNTGGGDAFGWGLSLSGDGTTLAVGAVFESSMASGINGDQLTDGSAASGAVYMFTHDGSSWTQQAYIKASNPGDNDMFGGHALALSADGNTLAVGAQWEDSAATGIDGNQWDDVAADAGAVYLFSRSATTWSQQAYIKASNTGIDDNFGSGIALSADGNTLAVGASLEDSSAAGIDGDPLDDSGFNNGAVYLFQRSGTSWAQQHYIKSSNSQSTSGLGASLDLSADGTSLAAGAAGEDSAATGINGDQTDTSASGAGAVYLY